MTNTYRHTYTKIGLLSHIVAHLLRKTHQTETSNSHANSLQINCHIIFKLLQMS